MPLNDLEFEYNTLVVGGDTAYPVINIEGLDPPDNREELIEKALDHGSYTYSEFLTERRVTLTGFLLDATAAAVEAKVDSLRRAFSPRRDDMQMVFKFPGRVEQRVNCKPVKRNWPNTRDYTLGYVEWMVQLLAGDPRIYAELESSRVGAGIANNAGTFPTYPTITIIGAYNNPVITNTTYNQAWSLTGTGIATDTLVIDFFNQTVKKNGVSIYNQMNVTSEWWQLQPGNNDIAYVGGGALTIDWRSAWI